MPGICYRLWDEPQTGSLEAYTKPEILAADLSSLRARSGAMGRAAMPRHSGVPRSAAKARAERGPRILLRELGALDGDSRITEEGKKLRALPLPPRLARMVVDAAAEGAGARAADIALVLTERGLGGNDVDLLHRLDDTVRGAPRMREDGAALGGKPQDLRRSTQEAISWAEDLKPKYLTPQRTGVRRRRPSSVGAILALAYPDRIAKNRGAGGGFLLANGRGANVDQASPLARQPFIAVAEIAGSATQARIILAAANTQAEIETRFASQIETRDLISFDAQSMSLRGRGGRRLGAIALADRPVPVEATEENARKLAAGIAQIGIERLPWTKALTQWRDRVMFLRKAEGDEWPDPFRTQALPRKRR